MVREARQHADAMEYTADGLRDLQNEFSGGADEVHIQASMQAETAKAIHRLAAAVESLDETLADMGTDDDV